METLFTILLMLMGAGVSLAIFSIGCFVAFMCFSACIDMHREAAEENDYE